MDHRRKAANPHLGPGPVPDSPYVGMCCSLPTHTELKPSPDGEQAAAVCPPCAGIRLQNWLLWAFQAREPSSDQQHRRINSVSDAGDEGSKVLTDEDETESAHIFRRTVPLSSLRCSDVLWHERASQESPSKCSALWGTERKLMMTEITLKAK